MMILFFMLLLGFALLVIRVLFPQSDYTPIDHVQDKPKFKS